MATNFDIQASYTFDVGASPVEMLIPNELSFQWLFGKQAFGFIANNASRRLVDVWAERLLQIAAEWDPQQWMVVYNDFSDPRCIVTPYSRVKNEELARSNAHLSTFAVAVIAKTPFAMLLSLATKINIGSHRVNRLFVNHADAMKALMAKLEALKHPKG